MNLDDSLYALFALDTAELLTAAGETLLVDTSALPLPQDSLPPLFLAPIAGGAPGIPNPWDVFRGIFGSAADLLGKIGEGMVALWNTFIWPIMGGAIRWLWDGMSFALTYLKGKILDLVPTITQKVWDAVQDLWGKVSTEFGNMAGKVTDAADWLWGKISPAFNTVWGWIAAGSTWVYEQVSDALDSLWDGIAYSVTAVFNRVGDLFQWVTDRTGDAAGWVVNTLLPAITGGFDLVGDAFAAAAGVITGGFVNLAQGIGSAVGGALEAVWTHLLEPFVDLLNSKLAIPGKLIAGEYDTMGDFLTDLMDPPPSALQNMAFAPVYALMAILSVVIGLSPALAPINEKWAQSIYMAETPTLLARGDLQEARWRELNVDIEEQLARLGYAPALREAIAQIDHRIPGPSDLITMAVREAFTPEIAQKFGQYEDFPAPVEEYLAKQGFYPEDEWARRYWAAHWDLPSAGQGFEMLHRGVIDQPTLNLLLRALDVMPFWRDKLTQIAYSPLTRVDVRRMYKIGLLGEEEVVRAYMDLGYTEVNARRLAEFTKQYYGVEEGADFDELSDLSAATIRLGYRRHVLNRDEAMDYLVTAGYAEDVADFLLTLDDVSLGLRPDLDSDVSVRDLTQAPILQAYARGIWNRDRAQQELEDMGYMAASADLLLQLEDVKAEGALSNLQTAVIREQFLSNAIQSGEARSRLTDTGMGTSEAETQVLVWELQRAERPRRLTTAQVQAALRDGLITESQFLDRMAGEGYADDDAKILLAMTDVTAETQEKLFSVGQIQEALRRGIMTPAAAATELKALGYNKQQTDVVIALTPAAVSVSSLQRGVKEGVIGEQEFLAAVIAQGYTADDAAFLLEITPRPAPTPV